VRVSRKQSDVSEQRTEEEEEEGKILIIMGLVREAKMYIMKLSRRCSENE
jgi:hypothetical protein